MSTLEGRWRRVYSHWWLQGAVQSLDDGERAAALYLLTGPQSTSVGCFRLSTAQAVEDLGNVGSDEFNRRRDRVCEVFGWQFDHVTRVLWMPEWIGQNPVQSANVVIGWRKLLSNVPDCAVKARAVEAIHAFLENAPEKFRRPFEGYHVELPEEPSVELPVELPKAPRKARSVAKPKNGVTQRSSGPFRDQGSGEQASALRAVAHNGKAKAGDWQRADGRLLSIARAVLEDSAGQDRDYCIDHFLFACREAQIDATRQIAMLSLEQASGTSFAVTG